jgi:hypothetical protein
MIEIGEATLRIRPDFSEFDEQVELRLRDVERRMHELATVTVTVSEDGTDKLGQISGQERWEGILAFEGYPSDGDSGVRRFLMSPLGHRELPLPLMVQTVNEEGHGGAQLAGRIDSIERIPASEFDRDGFALPADLPETAFVHFGSGVFDSGEVGREAARLVRERMLRGASVDLSGTTWVALDPETFEEIPEEEMGLERILSGDFLAGAKGAKIAGVTLTPHPSFGNAKVSLVASASFVGSQMRLLEEPPLVACAAGPLAPPASWFDDPKLTRLTPLTVTPEGRVFGHVATWDCHAGYEGMCMTAPRSKDGYARFHTGTIVSAEGKQIRVGRITVKPHAPARMTPEQVMEHYSDASRVAAFIRIYDDAFGIAAAGVTRSDAPKELLRDFYANPPSGDWRRGELLGFSCVPLPGFPVAAPQAFFIASAEPGEEGIVPEMLLLPPVTASGEEKEEEMDATEADILLAAAQLAGPQVVAEILDPWPYLDEMRTYTAEQRREYARRGIALPDGSFPIPDCAAAEDAIRSQGRGQTPASQRRVRRHIRKRVRALGCTGDIFEDYK